MKIPEPILRAMTSAQSREASNSVSPREIGQRDSTEGWWNHLFSRCSKICTDSAMTGTGYSGDEELEARCGTDIVKGKG
jgi:hypothetical protein